MVRSAGSTALVRPPVDTLVATADGDVGDRSRGRRDHARDAALVVAPLEVGGEVSALTISQVGERWPDAVVMWDRDVAPALDWEPRFTERSGMLWAVEVWPTKDIDGNPMVYQLCTESWQSPRGCRCRVWEPTLKQWWSHARWSRLQRLLRLNRDLNEGRLFVGEPIEWRREWLGEFVEPEDDRVAAHRYSMRGLQ